MNPPLQVLIVAVGAGVLAQGLGRRLQVPAIIPLLLFGRLLGPDGALPLMPPPAEVFPGGTLAALVNAGIILILFEGGLSLNLHDLRLAPRAVRNLLSIGAAATFGGAACAARYLGGLDWTAALLFGSFMIVTGPTVIGPLLKQARPSQRIRAVLLWESILVDAVAARGTNLDWRERLHIACISPRGVVAAFLAFGFAYVLGEQGLPAELGATQRGLLLSLTGNARVDLRACAGGFRPCVAQKAARPAGMPRLGLALGQAAPPAA